MSNEPIFTAEQVQALLEPYILAEKRNKEWHDSELRTERGSKHTVIAKLKTLEEFLESKHPKVFKVWEEANQPSMMQTQTNQYPSDWEIKKRLGL